MILQHYYFPNNYNTTSNCISRKLHKLQIHDCTRSSITQCKLFAVYQKLVVEPDPSSLQLYARSIQQSAIDSSLDI